MRVIGIETEISIRPMQLNSIETVIKPLNKTYSHGDNSEDTYMRPRIVPTHPKVLSIAGTCSSDSALVLTDTSRGEWDTVTRFGLCCMSVACLHIQRMGMTNRNHISIRNFGEIPSEATYLRSQASTPSLYPVHTICR